MLEREMWGPWLLAAGVALIGVLAAGLDAARWLVRRRRGDRRRE